MPATTSGQGLAGGAPEVDLCFGRPPSPAASLAPQDAMQTALLQQSQALSTLVGHLVSGIGRSFLFFRGHRDRGQRRGKEGEVAGCSGRAFRGFLSPGHAGSFQTAKPFSSMSQLVRRLVGAGVDVPLLRTVRGVWGASGSRLCHVVFGPCSRLSGPAGRSGSSGVPRPHLGGRRPERLGQQPLGFCLDFDPFGGPSGSALPCQAVQLEPEIQGVLATLSCGLDHMCAAVLEGDRSDNDPTSGKSGFGLQSSILSSVGGPADRATPKTQEATSLPQEAEGRRCAEVSFPAPRGSVPCPPVPAAALHVPLPPDPLSVPLSPVFQATPPAVAPLYSQQIWVQQTPKSCLKKGVCSPQMLGPKATQRCTRPPPGLSAKPGLGTSLDFSTEVSFATWAGGLLRAVLRTRTPFAAFLRSTLHLPRPSRPAQPSKGSYSKLFPLPILHPGVFERFSFEIGSRARRRIMHRRLLHVVCMGLNFLHANFVPPPLDSLSQSPTAAQQRLVAHVSRHLKAFGASVGAFVLPDAGRRNPQLIARLSELSAFLSSMPGLAGDAYADLSGAPVATRNDIAPALEPYRSLDVSRLRLSGRGLWDPNPFLSDDLYMAHNEPSTLLHGLDPPGDFLPVWTRESPSETAALARLWDSLGLLHLVPATLPASDSYMLARAFNCYKGPDKDRQVIDRRGRNWAEARLCGPSLFIPVGPMLGMLEVSPSRQTLLCAATDRKDFYHQIAVSRSKATSNALGPALPRAFVESTSAFASLLADAKGCACMSREQRGDCLKDMPLEPTRGPLLFDKDHYLVCFKAIAQGDHLGVEIATCAHGQLLEEGGLLGEASRICSNMPFKGCREAQGLVIDDYFSVCVHDLDDPREPICSRRLSQAKSIYRSEGLAGSDDKDIVAQPVAKIAGAEVCSSPFARSMGLVTLASPAQKRVALALVSLECARFALTSDALHLSLLGGWTSTLLFRRPLMAVLASAHGVVCASKVDARRPALCVLPRPAAQELVLLSVLAPLAQMDLAAPIDPTLYASDASESKGGFVKAHVGTEITRPLWRTASKKGGYSRLLAKEEAILAKFDDPEPFDLRAVRAPPEVAPQRPLAYVYDFIEVYSGSGRVASALGRRGFGIGPSIDIGESPFFNMEWLRTIEWLIHLLQHRRLRSFLVAPPCTTFSPAAHPACRSYDLPRGFCPTAPKTLLGTVLALRALTLLFVAIMVGAIGVLEQPRLSKMAWLKEWRRLILLGAREFWTASCSFGSPHRKEFRFLAVGIDLSPICRPCSRDHGHIRVQGKYTRESAKYTPLLAEALAHEFSQALRRDSHVASLIKAEVAGLENPIVNDIVLSSAWLEGSSWYWRAPVHINILETAAVLRLLRHLAFSGPRRIVILVDSSVALHAIAKGRSPSRGLTPLLRKISAVCLVAGLYASFHFVPTRYNPADCPTRDYALPPPAHSRFVPLLSLDEVYEGLAAPKLRRCDCAFCYDLTLLASRPSLAGGTTTVLGGTSIPLWGSLGRVLVLFGFGFFLFGVGPGVL